MAENDEGGMTAAEALEGPQSAPDPATDWIQPIGPSAESDSPSWDELMAPEEEPAAEEAAEEDHVAAVGRLLDEDTPPPQEGKKPWSKIKNPEARARRLQKERDLALEKMERMEQMLQTLMPKDGTVDEDIPPADPDSEPVRAILEEIKSLKEENRKMQEEREREKQQQFAAQALNVSNTRLNETIANDPVFEGAFNHVTHVVMNLNADRPEWGATERDRQLNILAALMQRQVEWHKQGKDPVEEIYRQAIKYGFDPDGYADRVGVQYDDQGRAIRRQAAQPAPQQPAAKKPATPAEKIRAARQRQQDTASIANVVGKPYKRFDAKTWARKDDRAADWELRKLVAEGEIPAGRSPGSRYPDLVDLIPPEAIIDDGA